MTDHNVADRGAADLPPQQRDIISGQEMPELSHPIEWGRRPARKNAAHVLIARVIVVIASLIMPIVVAAIQAPLRSGLTLRYRLETASGPLLLIGILNLVVATLLGLPDLYERFRSRLMASVLAPVIAGTIAVALVVLFRVDSLPRSVFFATPFLLAPCYLIAASIANRGPFTKRNQHLVIVGNEAELESVRDDAQSVPRLDVSFERPTSDLSASLEKSRPDILMLCRSAREDQDLVTAAFGLNLAGTHVRNVLDFYEEWIGKVPLPELESSALFTDVAEIHSPMYVRTKRFIDVGVGAVLLIPLGFAIVLVAALNLIGNRGPLFFKQPRVGLRGKTFEIYKFRTMRPTKSTSGVWTADNDPRITSVGKILRKSHLDELPQAINILRGDLSVVGPRPEQVHYVQKLRESIPYYEVRHAVKPGLTGWAQVKYPYGATERDAYEKLQYELFYIRHQSLALDLQAMALTVHHLFAGGGK